MKRLSHVLIITVLFLFISSSPLRAQMNCVADFDRLGIPHQNVPDLNNYYYCFGYHHGKDRAWQMDYFRRVAQGRNAEVYGFSSLKGDLLMRLLELPELAERIYAEFPPEQRRLLEIYALGANKGFKHGRKAHEFHELEYEPEPWKPVHSVLVLLLQSFDQTRKCFTRDYDEEKFREHWKEKTEALFDEDSVPWLNTILKDGEYVKATPEKKVSSVGGPLPKLWGTFPSVFGEESGSNNWVVSKEKSKFGKAILANDPHLDLRTPLFWYWIHLRSPQLNTVGASLPGVPMIASGTNGKVAWGLTNAYINTADAVFVKDYPSEKLRTVRPTVKVKFGPFQLPFFFKSFERSDDSDIVLPLETASKEKLFLRWTGYSLTAKDLVPMFNFAHAASVQEMNDELKGVGIPAWNFVFADRKGEIGYRVVGKSYKMTKKNPFGIPSMTYQEFKLQEFLTPEERPAVLRPKRNYVYSANNRHWPADAKFYGGRAYSHSFRGGRIDELLQTQQDIQTSRLIQCDRLAVDARWFVPLLRRHVALPEFDSWDYSTAASSVAPSLYRRLMDLLMEEWHVNEYGLYHLLQSLDQKRTQEFLKIVARARSEAGAKRWGEFHQLSFSHLSKNTNWVFSPAIPGLGDNHSVDPGTSKWDEEQKRYEQYSGASMRMIIELGETPTILLALPGLNRHYTKRSDDRAWTQWAACEYSRVMFW